MKISYDGNVKQVELNKQDCVCTIPVHVHAKEQIRIRMCPAAMPDTADSYSITIKRRGYNSIRKTATRDGDCIYADFEFCEATTYDVHGGYVLSGEGYVCTGIITMRVAPQR